MVIHEIFGVKRDIDIPADAFPTEAELAELESVLPEHEHGWFDSVHKGAKLHYFKFLPNHNKPKALVVFMHGIQGNAGKGFVVDGRKLNMALQAEACLKQGYALYAFDLYGHGYSEGTRFFIPSSWQTNKTDLVNFINLVASKHEKDIPIFIMGESYGSTLSILAAKDIQQDPSCGPPQNLDSIILTAPAIVGDMPPYPVYALLRYVLAPLFPESTPFFMPNPISADRIWGDPRIRAKRTDQRYMEMMLDGCGRPFRLGTALNLVLALEQVREEALDGFQVPFCIIHGTKDHGVPIEGSEYMWDKTVATVSDKDRTFHRMEGAFHDLFGDTVADQTMQHCVDWIEKRLAEKAIS